MLTTRVRSIISALTTRVRSVISALASKFAQKFWHSVQKARSVILTRATKVISTVSEGLLDFEALPRIRSIISMLAPKGDPQFHKRLVSTRRQAGMDL